MELSVALKGIRRARLGAVADVGAWWQVGGLGLLVFVTTAVYAVQVRNFTVSPDELAYVKQAIHIADTGWLVRPDFMYYNSASQLLPLVAAPFFGALDMHDALVAVHVFFALLLASAIWPAYLLARRLELGHLPSLVAALLCTATPWLTFAGTMMTEAVAFPVFMWALLAMQLSVEDPSPRRDAIALVAMLLAAFARPNLVVLLPALLAAILLRELASGRFEPKRVAREHRLLVSALGVTLVSVGVLARAGQGGRLIGIYSDAVSGNSFRVDAIRSGLDQLAFVALATGGVPLALAIAWGLRTLRSPAVSARRSYAAISLVLIVGMTAVAGLFGTEHLVGTLTITARYLFYLTPVLLMAFVAYLVEARPGWRFVAAGIAIGVGLALFIKPAALGNAVDAPLVSSIHVSGADVGRAFGLGSFDPRPELAALIAIAAIAAVLVVRRLPRPAGMLVVAAPVLVLGIVTTAYRMHSIVKHADETTLAGELSWIDPIVGDKKTGLLVASFGDPQRTADLWTSWAFWNKQVDWVGAAAGSDTEEQNYIAHTNLDARTGRMQLPDVDYVVTALRTDHWAYRETPLTTHGAAGVFKVSGGGLPLAWAVFNVTDDGRRITGRGFPRFRVFSGPPRRFDFDLLAPPGRGAWRVSAGGKKKRLTGWQEFHGSIVRRAGEPAATILMPPGVRVVNVHVTPA